MAESVFSSRKMLNALLIAPEFDYSFWFLENTCKLAGTSALLPPLGLLTVAALLPQTWGLRVKDLNVEALSEEDWQWADVVLFSCMFNQLNSLRELAPVAHGLGKPTVVGGPLTSSYPQAVFDLGCTYVVVGECESTVGDLVAAVETGAPPAVFRAVDRPDITETVIPRYDLINLGAYAHLSVQTSRGCPHNCEFCDVVKLFGRKQRFKSPQQVIRELDYIHSLGWKKGVFIADDNFIGNKENARVLLDHMIDWLDRTGHYNEFYTQVTASLGNDQELLDLMLMARFGMVFVGIETPSVKALKKANKYQNTTIELDDCLRALTQSGMTVFGSFIVGLDDEESGAHERICDFVEAQNIPVYMINLLSAPPGTDLWKRMEKEGRLITDICPDGMMQTNVILTRPLGEVQSEVLSIWRRLGDPSAMVRRMHRHCLETRPKFRRLQEKRKQMGKPPAIPRPKIPLSQKSDFQIFTSLCWRYGVRRNSRFIFWKALYNVIRRKPKLLKHFLAHLALGESLIAHANYLEKKYGRSIRSERRSMSDIATQARD